MKEQNDILRSHDENCIHPAKIKRQVSDNVRDDVKEAIFRDALRQSF